MSQIQSAITDFAGRSLLDKVVPPGMSPLDVPSQELIQTFQDAVSNEHAKWKLEVEARVNHKMDSFVQNISQKLGSVSSVGVYSLPLTAEVNFQILVVEDEDSESTLPSAQALVSSELSSDINVIRQQRGAFATRRQITQLQEEVIEIEQKLQRLNQRVTDTSETLPALVHDEIHKQLEDLSDRFAFVVRYHDNLYKEKLSRVRDAAAQIISDQIATIESQYETRMASALQSLQSDFDGYKSEVEAVKIRHRTELDMRDVQISRLQAMINQVVACGIDVYSDVPLNVQMSRMSLQRTRSNSLSSGRRKSMSRWSRQNGSAQDLSLQGGEVRTPSDTPKSTRTSNDQLEPSSLHRLEEEEEKLVVAQQPLPPATTQQPVRVESAGRVIFKHEREVLPEPEDGGSGSEVGRELEDMEDEAWLARSSQLSMQLVGSRCDCRKKVYNDSLKSQLEPWRRPAGVVITWHPTLADGPAGTRSPEEMQEALGTMLGKELVACGGDGEDDPMADGKVLDAVVVLFLLSDSYAKDRRCLRHFRLLVERESLVVIPVVIAKDVDENNSMMSEETEMGSMLKGLKIEDVTGKESWGVRSQSLIKIPESMLAGGKLSDPVRIAAILEESPWISEFETKKCCLASHAQNKNVHVDKFHNILQAMSHSQVILIFMSDEYCSSSVCSMEFEIATKIVCKPIVICMLSSPNSSWKFTRIGKNALTYDNRVRFEDIREETDLRMLIEKMKHNITTVRLKVEDDFKMEEHEEMLSAMFRMINIGGKHSLSQSLVKDDLLTAGMQFQLVELLMIEICNQDGNVSLASFLQGCANLMKVDKRNRTLFRHAYETLRRQHEQKSAAAAKLQSSSRMVTRRENYKNTLQDMMTFEQEIKKMNAALALSTEQANAIRYDFFRQGLVHGEKKSQEAAERKLVMFKLAFREGAKFAMEVMEKNKNNRKIAVEDIKKKIKEMDSSKNSLNEQHITGFIQGASLFVDDPNLFVTPSTADKDVQVNEVDTLSSDSDETDSEEYQVNNNNINHHQHHHHHHHVCEKCMLREEIRRTMTSTSTQTQRANIFIDEKEDLDRIWRKEQPSSFSLSSHKLHVEKTLNEFVMMEDKNETTKDDNKETSPGSVEMNREDLKQHLMKQDIISDIDRIFSSTGNVVDASASGSIKARREHEQEEIPFLFDEVIKVVPSLNEGCLVLFLLQSLPSGRG
ncbi:hypothetical protein GUITHDRAFT_114874 [Guillardia theta CCMP2712]|uniref:TIR domain-containing protein n=1 Tax=Guillardia theta (strain CCMP2712) TaxID=905079 RepID=L1ISW2_GUITC|nr:hypothetical protein GUITHDRAFT_114874 [Guillardia theta CCMP2712]EKX38994.1 hypothetical protein GUITHDRAFT_114874 [Guillardia theta CCMP2712]|eukprot:XP_005825974.1 hypothetical protein GUITHDRAFT_114874 [Guillardia theta CCMP2712]